MTFADLIDILDFNRQRTMGLVDNLAKHPKATTLLGWRPAPGRATPPGSSCTSRPPTTVMSTCA